MRFRASALGDFWHLDSLPWDGFGTALFDLIGGNLEGEWRVPGEASEPPILDSSELLGRPVCRGPLRFLPGGLECRACGEGYPVVEAIPVLIAPALRQRLYPSLAAT